MTPCLSCSLGLDYSPLELIPRARARERKKERNAEQREPLKQAINQIDRQSWCVAFPLSLGVFQACFTVALACKERADKPYRRRTSQFSLSLSLSLSLRASEERRREERERERGSSSKIDGRDARGFLSLVFSFPCSPAHSNSNLLSLPIPLPAITAAPSRHQGKNGFEKREKRGRSLLSFLASL